MRFWLMNYFFFMICSRASLLLISSLASGIVTWAIWPKLISGSVPTSTKEHYDATPQSNHARKLALCKRMLKRQHAVSTAASLSR